MRSTRALVLALSLAACGEDAPASVVQVAPVAETPTAPALPQPTPTPEAAPQATIARADVDALLATWLDAQNQHDFDRYAALYATRFEGVRRTERDTFQLDHDAWIADRRRLFSRPMEVAMRDVEVALTPTVANVHMTQRWASGRYVEQGPKRMVIVREGDGLRIASEEMLEAHAVSAASSAGIYPVLETEEGALVVLGEATQAGRGAPRDVTADVRVAMTDAPTDVPPPFAALVGQPVQLVSDTGGVCTSTIGSLAIAAFVRPHFSTEQAWEGEDFDDTTPAVVTPRAQIAAEVESMAETHYWVGVARASTCGHALAAVPGTTAPEVAAPLERQETRAAVLRALSSTAERQSLVDELREGRDVVGEPALDDAALAAELERTLEIREIGDAQSSIVEARIPFPGECGGSEHVVVFTRRGTALERHTTRGWSRIGAVVDVNGARVVVASYDLGDVRRIVRLGANVETLGEWRVADFDCGC